MSCCTRPPSTSWLETDAADADPNQLNADLIDSWQSESDDDDDDDDPYVDWLSDDPNELTDDLGIFAAGADETSAEALALPRTMAARMSRRAPGDWTMPTSWPISSKQAAPAAMARPTG